MNKSEKNKILIALKDEEHDHPFQLQINHLVDNPRFKYELIIRTYHGEGDEHHLSLNHDYQCDDTVFGIPRLGKTTIPQEEVIATYQMLNL